MAISDNSQTGTQSELSAKQAQALACLLSKPTLVEAAAAADVSVSSLIRWTKEDAFAVAYRDARREVVNHAVTQLQGACSKAVKVLVEVAEDGDAPAGSRVSAARAILEASLRAVEIDDLGARVEALEGILKEQPK